MSVDMRTVKVGDKVRLRSGAVAEIKKVNTVGSYPCCHNGGGKLSVFVCEKGECCISWPEMDVVEILPAEAIDIEKPKDDDNHCHWHWDRVSQDINPAGSVWKTECGFEFDRLRGGEQPRKHLCMEFCPYCGRRIYDETQDC